MQEAGIDLSNAVPQKLTQELAEGASLLITMGCGDKCPTSLACAETTGRYAIPRVCLRTKCVASAMR